MSDMTTHLLLPYSLCEIRMAIRVAELARAGLTLDWMPGAVSRCVPTLVRQNLHGTHVSAVTRGEYIPG